MKKRTIATMLSLIMTAALLGGCSQRLTPATPKEAEGSDDVKESDEVNESENSEEVQEEKSASEDDKTESDQPAAENDDTSSEETEDSTDISSASKTPTFKIAQKKYSIKYDGDVKFDEANEESKDYSNGILYEATFQYLLMDDECKNDFPLLYEAVNKAANDGMSESDKYAESTAADAKGMYEDAQQNGYSFYGPFTNENEVSVSRSDATVLSVYDFSNEYGGGVHGMYGATGTNYDAQTGNVLSIDDVLEIDESALNEIIVKELKEIEEYDGQFANVDSQLESYKFDPKEDAVNNVYEYGYTWYFSRDGLHIIFNPYEIASYADGMQDIVIGYSEYPGTINEKYIPEESSAYCIKEKLSLSLDTDDTERDYLHIRYTPSEYDKEDEENIIADSFELVKGDKSAKGDAGFYMRNTYSLDTYKVGTEDGREYVYIFIPIENDYLDLEVFDISNDDIKFVGSDGFHDMEESSDNWFNFEPLLTNPYDMHLCRVGDAFGTYTYYGSYEVGSDGMPVKAGNEFTLAWKSTEAYSKADIKADVVDEDGKVLEADVVIPKGEHFVPLRTDGESYMIFMLDDGRYINVKYASFDYPASLEEGAIDELFDGLMYAG